MAGLPPQRFRPGGIMAALLGAGLIARGRVDGINLFDNTPRGFVVSLVPMLTMLLISTLTLPSGGDAPSALTSFVVLMVLLLTPLALSEWLAGIWGREAAWLRFAIALNWCQWLMPVAALVGLVVAAVMVGLGFPQALAKHAVAAFIVGFGLWLEFFLARNALGLPRTRAVLLLVAMNIGTALLFLAAGWLADTLTDSAA